MNNDISEDGDISEEELAPFREWLVRKHGWSQVFGDRQTRADAQFSVAVIQGRRARRKGKWLHRYRITWKVLKLALRHLPASQRYFQGLPSPGRVQDLTQDLTRQGRIYTVGSQLAMAQEQELKRDQAAELAAYWLQRAQYCEGRRVMHMDMHRNVIKKAEST